MSSLNIKNHHLFIFYFFVHSEPNQIAKNKKNSLVQIINNNKKLKIIKVRLCVYNVLTGCIGSQ